MSENHYDQEGHTIGWTDDNGRDHDSNGHVIGWHGDDGRIHDSNGHVIGWEDSAGYSHGSDNYSDYGSSDEGSGSGSGSCYIATATLRGGGSEEQLNILRLWRSAVLRATVLGRKLEGYYDYTGPAVAAHVRHNHILGESFRLPFVVPAVWLAQQRIKHPHFAPVANILIYLIFLIGLVYGSVVYLFTRHGA